MHFYHVGTLKKGNTAQGAWYFSITKDLPTLRSAMPPARKTDHKTGQARL